MDGVSRGRDLSRREPPQAPRGPEQGATRTSRNDRQPQSRQNPPANGAYNGNTGSRANEDSRGYAEARFDTDRPRDRDWRDTRGDPARRPPNRGTAHAPPPHLGKRQRGPGSRRDSDTDSEVDRSSYKPYQDGGRKRRVVDSPANGRQAVPTTRGNAIPLNLTEDVLDIEEEDLAKFMGFSTFKTTKNTKVPGNEFNYGVSKVKASQYRQYMNRVGGFNRPLSPTRGNKFAKPADTDVS